MLNPRTIGEQRFIPPFLNSFLTKLFVFICCGLLASCDGCTPDQADVCSAGGLDSACYPKLDTLHKPLPAAHLKQINFFIETSGSMQGYMPANSKTNTEFQILIPDILHRAEENYPTSLYTIFDSKSKFRKENADDMISNRIPKGDFKWSGNTYVPIMIDSVEHYLDSDKVNIFISDCIYSPVSSNVKMTAQTISEIRGVTRPLAGKYATEIYMVKSTYFPKTGKAVQSPYYFVMQGKQENLDQLAKLIRESLETFKQTYEEIHFGDKYPVPYYTVLPYSQTSSNFVGGKNPKTGSYTSLQEVDPDVSPKTEFWVGIDLDQFPTFTRTTAYLDSNLSVAINNGSVKILQVAYKVEKENADDSKLTDKCDAFVKLSVDAMPGNIALVTLSLKRKRPEWVGKINHDTLAVKETLRTKTFGWANIITGFDQAYENTATDTYFNQLNISLIKKQ